MGETDEPSFAPNLYFDSSFDMEAAKILPGEYYVTQRDMVLVTVLGSCVAACIRDRVTGIGGMNHFMLPDTSPENTEPTAVSTRYGTYAMEMMINQLLKMGANKRSLEAKIFGGGSVVRGFKTINVGERNATFAVKYLQAEGISLVSKDLLDTCSRKVYFFPSSGRVMVKKLRSLHNETIFSREQIYKDKLKVTDIEGGVELF